MQIRPDGAGGDDAREWVKAYLDALVMASVNAGAADSSAYSRRLAVVASEAGGRRVETPRMARRWSVTPR